MDPGSLPALLPIERRRRIIAGPVALDVAL